MKRDIFPSEKDFGSLIKAQLMVASRVLVEDRFGDLKTIAGVDQAFLDDKIISGIVILDYDTMDVIEKTYSIKEVEFPYIPSFLSFREGPAIISAFRSLKTRPDLLMVDGCGINHPRSAGLATHIGVALDMATIGVAKKLLCGIVEKPINIGEHSPILLHDQYVGASLLSKKGCNPIIIAPGHKVSLISTIDIVRHCLRGHKLPEPIRVAHKYVGDIKRKL
ncbi:MAG: endonuclease V [Methanocellales archaeon]|nr:endonuclease V [Methanocellales archaeon]MDD3291759.1 endonuclease V [Methanocellales archaeon]MDD5235109.1 endonuclease V [Methanocellales archaeon]MDD5485247.1 endonuclease V [Methanocellales archaeon]